MIMYHLDYSEWKLLDFKIYEEVGRINRAENRLHFELEYMWSTVCWRNQSTEKSTFFRESVLNRKLLISQLFNDGRVFLSFTI